MVRMDGVTPVDWTVGKDNRRKKNILFNTNWPLAGLAIPVTALIFCLVNHERVCLL